MSLTETAEQAITDVFSDTTVSRSETRESLRELRSHINELLGCLDEDDRREQHNGK